MNLLPGFKISLPCRSPSADRRSAGLPCRSPERSREAKEGLLSPIAFTFGVILTVLFLFTICNLLLTTPVYADTFVPPVAFEIPPANFTCNPAARTWTITFNWEPGLVFDDFGNFIGFSNGQFLDLKFDDGTPWVNGDGSENFVHTEPINPSDRSYRWSGIEPNRAHRWRVANAYNFLWYHSNERTFTTGPCYAEPIPNPPGLPNCANGPYTAGLSWENQGPDWVIDISTGSGFGNWWYKPVPNTFATEAPAGFQNITPGGPGLVLNPDTPYYWRIYNGFRHYDGDPINVPRCRPSRPILGLPVLTCTAANTPQVDFAWSVSTNVTGYYLDVSRNSSFNPYSKILVPAGPAPGFTWNQTNPLDDGSVPQQDTLYYWRVWAFNGPVANGVHNNLPNPDFTTRNCIVVPDLNPPAYQVSGDCANDPYQVSLSWDASGTGWVVDITDDGWQSWWYKRVDNQFSTIAPDGFIKFPDITLELQPDKTYEWRLYYGVSGQWVYSPDAIHLPRCLPTRPDRLTAIRGCTVANTPQVDFAWSVSTNVTGYYLDVSTTDSFSGAYSKIARPAGPAPGFTWNQTSPLDDGLTPTDGTRYYWRVYAYNGPIENGLHSHTAPPYPTFLTDICRPGPLIVPPVAFDLAPANFSCNAQTGKWTIIFNWEPGYERDADGNILAYAQAQWLDLKFDDGTPWVNQDGTPNFVKAGPFVGTDRSYSWSGIEPNRDHRWRVYNFYSPGVERHSNEKTFLTNDCQPPGPALNPPAPIITGNCASGPYDVSLSWDRQADSGWFVDITTDPTFDKYWNRNVSGRFSVAVSEGFDSTNLIPPHLTALEPDTTYEWRLFYGVTGQWAPGEPINVPRCGGQPPPSPNGLGRQINCLADQTPQIAFRWDPTPTASGYWLDVAIDPFTYDLADHNIKWWNHELQDNNNTTFAWNQNNPLSGGKTPQNGQTYEWRVVAYNNFGFGPHTVDGTFTPDCSQPPPGPVSTACKNPQSTFDLVDNYLTDENGDAPYQFPGETVSGPDGESRTITKTITFDLDFSQLQALFGESNSNYLEGKFQDDAHRFVNLTSAGSQDFNAFHGAAQKTQSKVLVEPLKVKYVNDVYKKPELAEANNKYTDIHGRGDPKTIYDLVTAYGRPIPPQPSASDSEKQQWNKEWGLYWAKIPTATNEFYTGELAFHWFFGDQDAYEQFQKLPICPLRIEPPIQFVMPQFYRTTAVSDQINRNLLPRVAQSFQFHNILASAGNLLGLADESFKCQVTNPDYQKSPAQFIRQIIKVTQDILNPVKDAFAAPVENQTCVKPLIKGKVGEAPYCPLPLGERTRLGSAVSCQNKFDPNNLEKDNPNVICTFTIIVSANYKIDAASPSCSPVGGGQYSCTGTLRVWPNLRIPFLAAIWNNTFNSREDNSIGAHQLTGRPGIYTNFLPQSVKDIYLPNLSPQEILDLCEQTNGQNPLCQRLGEIFDNCLAQGNSYGTCLLNTLSTLPGSPKGTDSTVKQRLIGATDCAKQFVRDFAFKPKALQVAQGVKLDCGQNP